MRFAKQFYFIALSFILLLQLTGCGGGQTASSKTETSPALEMPSNAAAPAPSASELTVAPESAQSREQQSSSAVQPADPAEQASASDSSASTNLPEKPNPNQLVIEVGGKTFSATLADNEAAKAFAAYLPMTVQMGELNGQEKFYGLPDNLPAETTERPSTIHSGDIFCWSGNTLVLFYNTFSNSYGGYVRLGTVDDPAGLAVAVGSGNAEVTWSLHN